MTTQLVIEPQPANQMFWWLEVAMEFVVLLVWPRVDIDGPMRHPLWPLSVSPVCQWAHRQWWHWCSCVVLESPDTGRLCEMQSWVNCSVVASTVVLGGCCWAQRSAPRVNCPVFGRCAIFLNARSGTSLLHLCMHISLCPMDPTPRTSAYCVVLKHKLCPL